MEDFPLPDPFTLDDLIADIEAARDCVIHLLPVASPTDDLRAVCGLRVSIDKAHFILYRPRPTPNQTLNTIFHELAHLWLDHGNDQEVADELLDALRPLLAEALGTGAVMNARAHYGTRDEQEAELSASLIRHRIRQQSAVGQDLLSVMEVTLTHPLAPPRRRRT
ncbi:hypothetical protein CK936_24310 [Streptomyces albireticuli]|uniref:IrrE N-terminal-like domain-containing protein n=1 Tax=Streptomyces albireticuli TaxID=1940 RepID=A0A2A2D4E7_9ACTN|nr:hypothetical protein CK936_24310 [Streptomyces albireticuli]